MAGTHVAPTADINSIPNALIDRIEVLTSGASAAHGSDAVAGVANFILKDDFEGVHINAGFQQTLESDDGIYSADITLGANMADGLCNLTLNIAHTDCGDLFQGDFDFSFFTQFDDGNRGFINGGSSGIPSTPILSGALGMFSPDSFGVTFDHSGGIRPFITTGAQADQQYSF